MREMFKLAGILFLITAIAAVLLGFTNMATSDMIAEQLLQENINARKAVLPLALDFEKLEDAELESVIEKDFEIIEEIYKGIKDNQVVGYTFKTINKGFGGDMVVNVGISIEEKVTGIKVVSHTETPGLGAKAAEEGFEDQYREKPSDDPLEVVKTPANNDNEVEAITGATVTTNSVTDGVNKAIDFYNQYLK